MITRGFPMGQKVSPEVRIARERLRALSVDTLKRQWDTIGDNSYSPLGFDCADIHAELNARGHGAYCAV